MNIIPDIIALTISVAIVSASYIKSVYKRYKTHKQQQIIDIIDERIKQILND